DPALAARWAARLDALGPGLRVGICWRSGLRTAEREGLYSRLEDWAPLFALPGIRWVSLQYDAEAAEPELAAAEARSGIRIARWPDLDLADDLDGVAALTAGLDLVVSAAAAPAELSAALGVPTWRFGRRGEWTTLGTGTRPWFGSQRLFPAEPGEAVGAALGRVAAHLADLARPAPAAAAVSTPAPPAAAPEPPPGTLEAAIEHHREGRTDAAEPLYRSVLAHEPDQPVALHLLGHLLAGGRGSGGAAPERLEEGLRLMRRAVELVPDYVAALSNLAAALLAAGRPGDALERYRAARALRPGSAGILTGLGNALLALGRAGEAEAAQREAAALDPASAEVQANLGEALRAGGRLAEAEEAHRRAAALKPDWPGAWVNLGTVLAARERLEEAEAAYGRALSLDPGHPAALTNLGNLRRLQGRLPEAERLHRAALERAPGDPHALANLGLVLRDLSRHGEAAALFSRAQDAGGPEALARWNRSLSDLALGRTDTGWRDYEARFETPDGVAGRRLPMPRWQGEDIAGKRLLVWREQGLGDEILFSAHYADLQAMGVLLVVECDRRLVGLFSRLLPGALVREPTAAPDDADFHVPAGSLPGLLAPRLRDFPARPGWLRPDPGRAAAWARRLADLGPGLKVGICWRSGLLTLERRGLYLTLEELAPVLRVPGIIPVSLQYDRPEAEIAAAEAALGVRIVRWPDLDLRDDLEETAALTASLDLVVSAGTAVAEMAGALGVPVWRFAPVSDWTGLGTAVRPWFPTMRAWHPAPGQALADTGTAMAAALRAMAGVPDAVQAAPQPAAPPPAAPPPAAPALADLPTALAAHRAGRAAEAEAGYRAVLAADPDEPDALHLLGLLLHQGGRHAEGLPLVRRAAALDPGFAQAHNSLGSILRALGDGEGAGAAFRRAAGARPDYAEAWTNLGAVLAERRLPEEAEEAHRRALALRPDYPKALVNLGIARRLAGRPEEAQTAIRRALEIEPDMALAWTNLGVALTDLGRHAEAVRCHEAALARDPGMAEARNNLALARLAAGEAAQAAALLDDTAAGAPGFAPARYNRGLLALAGGDLARGWEEHEFRFAAGQAAPDRRFAIPRWEGGDVSGRRVLVWREQGLGDELMFASLYRDLAARCGHLVIECDPRLRSLFARALPGATVRSETDDPRDADLHVPAGSLPRLLRPALSRFDGAPFLAPDPAAGARWAERVRALGPGLKVGVCWRSIVRTADRDGAYTRLADWAPLFAVPGVVPVTLQYGDTEAELREAEARFGVCIHRWPDLDLRHDLDGVTALIASLDLVVTAATSVGELAGALGMPVWRFAGRNDWSMLGTGVRPWFASMRVFTAERGERAADVLPRIAAALSALAPRPEAPAEPAAHRDPLEAAVAHHREGRTAEAEALYRAVLGERPDDPAALHLLGLLRAQAGRAQEGIALMERAVALAPGYAAALVNLGNALQEAGRFGEAEARYRQALERSPGAPDALTNLGNALRAQGRLEEAAEAHRAALAASPGFAEAAANLGTVLKELDRPAEAAEQFRAALAGGRETADALTGLGDALRLLGRHGEAEALHRRAVAAAPGLAEARNNLARVLDETGREDAALAEYDRAVALDPGLASARLNRALLHLGHGRTAEGWEGYAWRFEADRRHPRRRFTIAEWRGGDLSGRRVLVWREQGLGD
ncbi:MAG TPA: tetratricopeptide repeat protein, partial [Azospirillaceae bacterium]|nr:tetratricopeptide repeat protein [Azospirillaceae bacterium]